MLFVEKGFEETTVQDIAVRAGVATGTVYIYFPSKGNVLLGLHEDFNRGLEERFVEVAGDLFSSAESGDPVDFRDAIDELLDSFQAYCVENRTECEVLARNLSQAELTDDAMAIERRFIEFLARSFEAGMQQGLMHTSDPMMAAYLLNAAFGFTIGRAIAFGDPPDLDRLVAQAKELTYKALAPQDAFKLLPRKPSDPETGPRG